MRDDTIPGAPRLLKTACALVACCAIAVFVVRSLGRPLWMDELLTLTLVRAESLPKLWSGIIMGIDGNPPLYLTAAWLIAHSLPQSLSASAVLKIANVTAVIAGTLALYRFSQRVASMLACWIGAFLFAALNDNLVYTALELRTYALYFLMAALAVLFQQRLMERRRTGDAVVLALIYAALALTHTFGIVYVVCIAMAGWLSALRDGPWRLTAAAVVPAIIALACWIPYFLQQSAVGQPYLWYGRPGLPDLLETLFVSRPAMWIAVAELCCLASAVWLSARRGGFQWQAALYDASWQPYRYAVLVIAGITGFTLAAWVLSVALFPLFMPRYFTPQLIVSFALHVAFGEWLVQQMATSPERRRAAFAVGAIIAPVALLGVVMLAKPPSQSAVSCAANGSDFEAPYVHGDLPVISESPHLWLPRATYAAQRASYLFPLDWDVVLKYPQRARGNAVDFHIMDDLRTWAGIDRIMSTEEILRRYPQFLAIEESGRAWFHNLRTTRDVTAQKLAEVTEDGQTCTLWNVTSVKARP